MSELPKFVKFDDDFPAAKITLHPLARRLKLRVARDDGSIRISAPPKTPLDHITTFLCAQKQWIEKQRQTAQASVVVADRALIPIEGQPRMIMYRPDGRMQMTAETLTVGGNPAAIAPKVKGFLKSLARDRLTHACDLYAQRLSRQITRITLRDTRSRWGSCSAQGALMFSWRLIMAPPEVLQYVAAHEVAHLIEMNHSNRFWGVVDDLYGPHGDEREWLRQEGASLLRYRFD